MGLSNDFKVLCNDIQLDNLDDMESTAGEIAKKLKTDKDIQNDFNNLIQIIQ